MSARESAADSQQPVSPLGRTHAEAAAARRERNAAALRAEQQAAVAEIAAAANALLLDWMNGSVQRARNTDCGDPSCGYASCRLANAILAYEGVADA